MVGCFPSGLPQVSVTHMNRDNSAANTPAPPTLTTTPSPRHRNCKQDSLQQENAARFVHYTAYSDGLWQRKRCHQPFPSPSGSRTSKLLLSGENNQLKLLHPNQSGS